MGLEICKLGTPKKETANLIYDLREYVINYSRLPWYKGRLLNSFLHSVGAYQSHFGSLSRAWVHCGIQRVDLNKWSVIN